MFDELNPGVGDFWVSYDARTAFQKLGFERKLKGFGDIHLAELKGTGDMYDKFRISLVNLLKEVRGPALSQDAPNLLRQAAYVSDRVGSLMDNAGDVLNSYQGDWTERLFLIDP